MLSGGFRLTLLCCRNKNFRAAVLLPAPRVWSVRFLAHILMHRKRLSQIVILLNSQSHIIRFSFVGVTELRQRELSAELLSKEHRTVAHEPEWPQQKGVH